MGPCAALRATRSLSLLAFAGCASAASMSQTQTTPTHFLHFQNEKRFDGTDNHQHPTFLLLLQPLNVLLLVFMVVVTFSLLDARQTPRFSQIIECVWTSLRNARRAFFVFRSLVRACETRVSPGSRDFPAEKAQRIELLSLSSRWTDRQTTSQPTAARVQRRPHSAATAALGRTGGSSSGSDRRSGSHGSIRAATRGSWGRLPLRSLRRPHSRPRRQPLQRVRRDEPQSQPQAQPQPEQRQPEFQWRLLHQ